MGDFGMIPIFIEHALYCIAYSLFPDFSYKQRISRDLFAQIAIVCARKFIEKVL
jgi:hypothetical protein